ncbi:uncharacterized protein BCR38DRAFT_338486 [Pseudomassariella vexata]|uniref:NAD(P)-binding protein n=1 Tax=Pseudomassariella vexata TaxID=1141098 RepID=A0A1Y2E6Y8_9PEZI|nr:uncharacterized protein BCR38DRAFT_338486 [Pseudomassariella vexata]ORY67279.1 hypothetical protein BCR38DRAFT_338486 [Pseudomassariella vexata]
MEPFPFSFTKTRHREPYPFIDPKRPELSVAGKNIVITGGGTGIGKAVAIAFAQAGAKSVSILGRRLERLQTAAEAIKNAGSERTTVLYQSADLVRREQVDKAVQTIIDEVGEIDIFVSNAGSLQKLAPVVDYDPTLLMRDFELNVLSTLNALQVFAHRAAPDAVLLNMSTAMAHVSPSPGGVMAYATSKAANLKMVDYFAVENPGIHVVNVHPGVVQTEINPDVDMSQIAKDKPELAGQFCVWLASSEARFLKGKMVWVTWDVEELLARADEIKNSRLLTCGLDGVPL